MPGIVTPIYSRVPGGSNFPAYLNQNYAGGFEGWKQRQFSSAPFGPGETNVQPGMSGPAQKPMTSVDRLKSEANPLDIMNSPAMRRLMELSNGGGALKAADETAAPAVARLREYLATNDPLGTAELPQLVRQRGTAELRGAAAGGQRRVEESFGGMHGSADPSAMAFMKEIVRGNAASGMGEVERAAAEAKIAERSGAMQFQKGVADSLTSWGATRGGLANADAATAAGAAGSALTAESFARNTFAQVFAQLLGIQNRDTGPSRPLKGYDRDGNPIYDRNPFPGIDSFGDVFSDIMSESAPAVAGWR